MDPFALQQAARTRTFRLVPLAAVAIIATAVATGLVFLLACWGVWLYFGDADLARDVLRAAADGGQGTSCDGNVFLAVGALAVVDSCAAGERWLAAGDGDRLPP